MALATLERAGVAHRSPPAPVVMSKRGVRLQLYVLLVALDALAVLCGFALANLIRFGDPWDEQGMTMVLLLLPTFIGLALNAGAYSLPVLSKPEAGLARALVSLGLAAGTALFFAFWLQASAAFSRAVFTTGFGAAFLFIILNRWLAHHRVRTMLGSGPLSELLIRDGVDFDAGDPEAAVIDAQAMGLRPDIFDPLMMDRLGHLFGGADRVIVVCRPEDRADWITVLRGTNADGDVLAQEIDHLDLLGVGRYRDHPTIRVSCGPLGPRGRFMKRALDLSIALPLLVLLAPALLLVAIAIRLESSGPVFFLQSRLGQGNRLFRMVKFRSMYTSHSDAAGLRSTARGDDRVTRIGAVIRRTSIDELPQLLNVVAGQMSLVGPRPHALGSTAGDKLFWELDTRYWHRHATKPGMTGLAQIRGLRGATLCPSDLTDRLQADLEYLRNWTIWRDVLILLATFRVVLHRNAF